MRPASAISMVVLLAIPPACRVAPVAPEFAVTLSIEDSVVARRSPNEVTLQVHVRLTNHDTRTIFYDTCGHALQKRVGDTWRAVASSTCVPTVYSYGLFTGESYIFSIRARANSSSTDWPAVGAEGEYRVVLFLSETPRNAYVTGFKPLGPASRTTPTFSVREELVII